MCSSCLAFTSIKVLNQILHERLTVGTFAAVGLAKGLVNATSKLPHLRGPYFVLVLH